MSLAEANRKYFDNISSAYDAKPWFKAVNDAITTHLQSNLPWIGIPFANTSPSPETVVVKLLDYACGTGLMSRTFGPYVDCTVGIDLSPNMVATYNARARAAGLSASTISAIVGDLFSVPPSPEEVVKEEKYWNFDLAAVGFAFHHFEDVVHASRCLKERLRPGGVMVFSDFLEGGDMLADEDGKPIPGSEGNHMVHNHGHHHGHHHGQDHGHHHGHGDHHSHGHSHSHSHSDHGTDDPATKQREEMNASIVVTAFTIPNVKAFLSEAGFVDVDVMVMKEPVYMEVSGKKLWRTVFFGRGRRPIEGAEGKSEL